MFRVITSSWLFVPASPLPGAKRIFRRAQPAGFSKDRMQRARMERATLERAMTEMFFQLTWKILPGLRGLSCSDFRAVATTSPDLERGVAFEARSENEA